MTLTTEQLREMTVNGRRVLSASVTLADLIAEQGLAGIKVATAVNGDFVAERARAATGLHATDRIEIVSVRQGG